jgi:predicted phage-related endonuclease
VRLLNAILDQGGRYDAAHAEKSLEDWRFFIGGSDARRIMSDDEATLLRLWREKRDEVELEDLSDVLIVQLGTVTDDLNRRRYERNFGYTGTGMQRHITIVARRRAELCPILTALV